jgi:Tfp pilus assembly protein PilO|tara:strand:+ start:5916 stop:6740 length:825 start_codon:yes stop_codon:yes gene_type:complete
MDKQKNLFIGIVAFVVLSCSGWYFMYFSELNKSLEEMNNNYNRLQNEKNKYSQIKNKFPAIEKEWQGLKKELTALINKIPKDSQYDNVTKMLFSLLEKNRLAVDNFNPSLAPLDEKQIINPETQEMILVEKYPIDVELRGSFIDFGNFLDQLAYSNYYLTIGNIQISQNQYSEGEQKISFISYIYTKNSSNDISLLQNNQDYANASNNSQNNSGLSDKSKNQSEEDLITEAIQTTGATSLVDLVKIIKHIKDNTGKDIDQTLALSLLQKKLKNL